jgi:hypothetical protein
MERKFTRRQAAALLATSAALAAQTPNPPPSQSPDQQLQASRDALRQNLEQLAQFPLPMSTEPAIQFNP